MRSRSAPLSTMHQASITRETLNSAKSQHKLVNTVRQQRDFKLKAWNQNCTKFLHTSNELRKRKRRTLQTRFMCLWFSPAKKRPTSHTLSALNKFHQRAIQIRKGNCLCFAAAPVIGSPSRGGCWELFSMPSRRKRDARRRASGFMSLCLMP